MRDMWKVQELMDICLDQRDKKLHQLRSQSQADGAQLAALSMQVQELISLVKSRAKVVGRDLEEINGQFDCHRGEINHLKIREKDSKEEMEKLKVFIIGAGHEAQVFKNCLDRMEESVYRCGKTPSEVGEEFVSSEDKGRTELSYASAPREEYVAPPIKNLIPIPIPAPVSSCCLGSKAALALMEEITKEPTFICDDLDGLLREVDEGRARDLQEGSSQSVVRSPSRLGSERWRRLNGIHRMHPGPGRRGQRATCSCPYLRRDSSRHPGELWVQESQEGLQDLHLTLDWEQSTPLFSGEMREFLPARLGDLDWSSRERSLSGCLVQSWVSGFAIHLRIGLSEVKGDAFLGVLEVDRMEDRPVVEMEGDMEVVNAEFKCRD